MSSSSPGFDCRRGGGDDSDTTSSSSISSDDDEDDDFDMFAKYKGTGMLMLSNELLNNVQCLLQL